jgi:hypothetical protein
MSVSVVDNTCKLKLHIPNDKILNTVFEQLGKKYEVAGTIYCDDSDNPVHVDITKGEADSVYTPNHVINFHTHPVSAYNNAVTVWGWPSGEDLRESLKFALAGNKAHLVFTVEGLYTIQVNPCKLKKMKELLNSHDRGILVFMVEEYFKTTHNFRGVDEVNGLAKKGILITPYSFVDFANSFNLNNLLCQKTQTHKNLKRGNLSKVGHTGIHSKENDNMMKYSGLNNEPFSKIPSEGFPEIDDNFSIKTTTAKKFIDESDFSDLRSINEFGKEELFPEKSMKNILERYSGITNTLGVCDNNWNNNLSDKWFFINFFPSNYYTQKMYFNGKKYVTPNIKLIKHINLKHEPFVRIFSNQKEGCTINSISKKNNFKTIFHLRRPPASG